MATGQENFSQFASSNVLSSSFLVGYDSTANVEKKFPAASLTSYIQGNLPVASSTQLGAVTLGSGLTMNGSKLSANVLSVNGATGAVVIQAVDTSTQSGFSLISDSGSASGTIGIRRIVGANNVVIQNDSFNNLQVGFTPTPSFSRVLINTIADDGSSVIQAGGQISTVNASNVVKAFGQSQGFTVQTAAGTQLSPTAVASGTPLGVVQMSGHNGSTFTPVASIAAYSEGAYTTSSTPSDLRFFTTSISSTTQTERMRLFPSGNLVIASTTDNGSQLQVTGTATVSAGLTAGTLTAGTISATGSITTPTPAAGSNNTTVPNTAWVQALISGDFASSLTGNGYQKMPSGLIIQWGQCSPTNGSYSVTFPIAFPNAGLAALANELGASAWTNSNVSVYGVYSLGKSGMGIRMANWNGTAFSVNQAGNAFWIAIGY
ncbi:gp53-like domain-containing protein [Paraburkholderia sediminicola]|uniref:gp53-like domain-containing protein n=1 Tax=Paraburkholderia sediminicola TaxID=458836 RepID=UPI0038BD9E81